MKVLGWRKLGAWSLVFGLVAASTFTGKDITDNGVEVIMWVTGFFFAVNMVEHGGPGIKTMLAKVFAPGTKNDPIEEPKR